MSGRRNQSHVRFYNNTIYGYADPTVKDSTAILVWGPPVQEPFPFGGTWEWVNNIVVDTSNLLYYQSDAFKIPSVSHHNIWYNGGDGNPASPPSWDASPRTSDPLFVNPISRDFRLQSNSPAINVGSNTVSSIVRKDFLGVSRSQGNGFDIGAFEYDEGTPPPPLSEGYRDRGGDKDESYSGSEDYRSSAGSKAKPGTTTYSPTLGQELMDLEATYKKGIINEKEYAELKKIIIEQRTKKK
jgi:hypothetical protein